MKNQYNKNLPLAAKAAGAVILAAFTQFAANPAAAGEREDALGLCRGAIAEAFQVSADESGAHFQESKTSAHAYTMRFQLRTGDSAARALTCKVKRGALLVLALNPSGAAALQAANQSAEAGAGQAAPLGR